MNGRSTLNQFDGLMKMLAKVFLICVKLLLVCRSDAWVPLKLLAKKNVIRFSSFLSQRPFRIDVMNTKSISFVDYIEVNTSVNQNGHVTLYVNALKNIPNPYGLLQIFKESSNGKHNLVLVNATIPYCNFLNDRKLFPIAQVFYRVLTKKGDFPKRCPILKVKVNVAFQSTNC